MTRRVFSRDMACSTKRARRSVNWPALWLERHSLLMRLQSILAPYLKHAPSFCFTLGSDKGNFYALTTIEDPHPKVIVYVWLPGTQLEFSHGSHVGIARGVPASNGLTHIPYSNLSKTRNLRDVSIKFHQGGTFIAHPRLALSITQGFGLGWGCKLAVKV
ncbi:hypothetical protein J3458_022429 [Metarhizium acridum]|uniref:uncharacterized protein n=1 Tax=Metarhizium acridum TaxID=92637 RepID=UPI001C6B800D|nr:hypothetical protein J3458_022429 [Metarhizium acridum]